MRAVRIEALISFSVETKIADSDASTTAGSLTFMVSASTFQMPVPRWRIAKNPTLKFVRCKFASGAT